MSRASIAALLKRNADACESAKLPECRCRCGGKMHGAAHSPEWVAAEAVKVEAELEAAETVERLNRHALQLGLELDD